jgi:hypothetical protein
MKKQLILVKCGDNVNQQLINMVFSARERNEVMTFNEFMKKMWDKNLVPSGELAEQALVKKSKGALKQNTRNKKASDFNDKSEHKYATVGPATNQRRCNIAGLKNKIGLLRVMAYDPLTDKNYFFRVPHSVYSKVASLKIYFDRNGNPKAPTRQGANFNMWDYECTMKQWAAK